MTRHVLHLVVVSIVVAAPAAGQIRLELVASGLSQPLAIVEDPTHPGVFFVAEKGGRIRTLMNGALVGDFLDLTGQVSSDGERGLLGIALAPDYPSSGRVFVNFTNPSGHTVIARYVRSASNAFELDPGSRVDLYWPYFAAAFIFQPHANHNGGHLAFGPDGMLYIALGDGGSGNDPDHLAQNPLAFLGKILRIDVSVGDSDPEGYDVPGDNPYVADPLVLPEIWAFGLRNPWRYSFDDPARGGTGGMYIGDVGQQAREEISYGPPGVGGRNYGWRNWEGDEPNVQDEALFPGPLIFPIFDYGRDEGTTVTGGVVYRGSALGVAYLGRYFFADFGKGRLWSLGTAIDPMTGEASMTDLIDHTVEVYGAWDVAWPVSFSVDSDGEILVVDLVRGTVSRIVLGLVGNGSFDNGLSGWFLHATPTPGHVVAAVNGGVLEIYRVPTSPASPTDQAVVLQPTGDDAGANTPLLAQFDLGNSSTERKRIAILIHDLDFSDLSVCTFWLSAGAPLRTYQMRTHTTEAWSNATISFYLATPGADGGAYQIDNVTMAIDPTGSALRTDCVDPTRPGTSSDPEGSNLLSNANFSTPINPAVDWGTDGQIQFQQNTGVFEFIRLGDFPAAVVLQATNQTVSAGEILTATFSLGNSSAVRKRVTAILHDLDFGDLSACTFWLAPNQPLSVYIVRTFATKAWSRATMSLYAATIGSEPWIQLDAVNFRLTPAVATSGTDCIEPGGGSILGASGRAVPADPFLSVTSGRAAVERAWNRRRR